LFLLITIALVACPRGVSSQAIRGTLIAADMGMPLSFGTVQLLDAQDNVVATAFSDALGEFVLRAPRAGTYSVRGEHMSADPLITTGVQLRLGQVITVALTLPLSPIELEEVVVSVSPERRFLVGNGFYERAATMPGTFITPEIMQQWQPYRPSDLFRRMPGVEMMPDPVRSDRFAIRFNRTTGFAGLCRPKMVVDGVTVMDFNIDDLPAEVVAAVEVYKSALQTPPQFAGGMAACGVIVIWTGQR
jgi:hypothetical protein